MKPNVIPISNSNINIVAELLYQRSKTLKSYTYWKYLSEHDVRFKGVIALIDGNPVGCFGSIPKQLKFSDGTIKKCGWFADWYVSPDGRGNKVGELLLNALSDYEPIMFGHPGPKPAHKIAFRNGYMRIGFHSRRRILLRKWSYSWKRGILISGIVNKVKTNLRINRRQINVESNEPIKPASTIRIDKRVSSGCFFVQPNSYENWIKSQPIAKSCTRSHGVWRRNGSNVNYFDEQLVNREKRRLVLSINGEPSFDVDNILKFIADAKTSKMDYIEIFTTNRIIDSILRRMGAWSIEEPPILVRGLDADSMSFQIQPWDRENWTFLASNKLDN